MSKHSFNIKSSKDFLNKLMEDYAEFQKNPISSRIALNCAMTAWHLTDWVAYEYEGAKKMSDVKDFQNKLKIKCPSLKLMQDITNGSKHSELTYNPKVIGTSERPSTFDKTFDFTFQGPLEITTSDGKSLIWIDEIEKVIEFWKDYGSLKNL